MKNHIAIKFIAILLCAVSLLGIVSSGLGLFVMTEGDLYNKTADQVREERIWEVGEALAGDLALRYASEALGGCSPWLASSHYGTDWYETVFLAGRYNIRILDGEGTEVYCQGSELKDGRKYSFPVTGQYLHLVNTETEQERKLKEAQRRADAGASHSVGGVEIPEEGISVNYASFLSDTGALLMESYFDGGQTCTVVYGENGEVHTWYHDAMAGYLLLTQDQRLVYQCDASLPLDWLSRSEVKEAIFQSPGEVNLHLRDERNSLGYLYLTASGSVIFVSNQSAVSQKREFPAVTMPQPPVLANVREMLPAEGTTVSLAAFYDAQGKVIHGTYDWNGIGYLYYNPEGGITLAFENEYGPAVNEALQGAAVAGVAFEDLQGELVYMAACENGVGALDSSGARLVWKSIPGLTTQVEKVQETVPAETEPIPAETAPPEAAQEETTGETEAPEEPAAPEETAPAETQEPSSASAVPTEGEQVEETVAPEPTETPETAETTVPETTAPPTEPAPAEAPTEPVEETVPPAEPVMINGKPLEEYQLETEAYYDQDLQQTVYGSYVRIPMPQYTVVMELAPDAMRYEEAYTLLELLREYRKVLLPTLGICLLVFAITVVYLCTAAGRKPKCADVHAGGLNRLPLDLYFALVFLFVVLAANIGVETLRFRLDENVLFGCAIVAGAVFLTCLLLVAFGFAFVAQIKTPGGYWWRHALCGQSLRIFIQFALWLEYALADKVFPFMGRCLKGLWKLLKSAAVECWHLYQFLVNFLIRLCSRFFSWLGGILNRFFSLLPITWQWLLMGCVIIFIAALTLNSYNGIAVIVGIVMIVAIIVYGAHCFGVLAESTRNMSRGDLNTKVNDKLLFGCFKEFAGDLNDLADVAVVAAQKQLRSERMKTELITNVSHDIKTPLTSIINYVDLLQKPHTGEEQAVYLEVLDRQSQRLKKLIDDLMEMSKASTGNMTVEISTLDAVESVNQALGEFADKLSAAHLTPVFRHTEPQVPIRADGKLVWRVLSNLLSNSVKYAMPGTRLYIDLMELEGKVIISLKNISREELNVDAEELMERFVRGDDSRNTEGSGLGLNIAKSLMELQKGQLQLLVDGDLFKVTLIFPGE